jgi:SAM-dependent methyltransferase
MNQLHLDYLGSPAWAEALNERVLPWIESRGDLGNDVLEVGPGPGLTTDILRARVSKLTAIELDQPLGAALAERLAGTNVEVVIDDASRSSLASDRFSTVTCFSMLHHMLSADDQDRFFAEVSRLLRPGGRLVGVDSRDHEAIREFHVDDTFTPLDPDLLPSRLERAGLSQVEIEVDDFEVRFCATKAEGS